MWGVRGGGMRRENAARAAASALHATAAGAARHRQSARAAVRSCLRPFFGAGELNRLHLTSLDRSRDVVEVSRLSLLLALAILVLCAPAADALTLVSGPPREGRELVAPAGDVNGDGRDDLALGSGDLTVPKKLDIVFGRPGLNSVAPPTDPAAGLHVTFGGLFDLGAVMGVAAGDVDGDGFDDVTVALTPTTQTPNTGVGRQAVLRGAPNAGAAEWAALEPRRLALDPSGGGPSLAGSAGDIDGDGKGDVLTNYSYAGSAPCEYSAETVASRAPCAGVRRGPGLATSEIVTPGSEGEVFNVSRAGDVNRDGRGDLVAFIAGGARSVLLLSQTDPGTPLRFAATSLGDVNAHGVGDVNGDGFDDLGLAPRDGTTGWVVLGAATVVPTPTHPLPAGLNPEGRAGDVNGDGIDDLVARTGDYGSPAVVLLGRRDGAPWRSQDTLPVPAPAGDDQYAFPAGDIDADGRDELITRSYSCAEACRQVTAVIGAEDDAAQLTAFQVSPTMFRTGTYRPSLRQGALLTTELTAAATVRIMIVSAFGGARRTFDVSRPAGRASWTWDGRINGRRLPTGVYRVAASVAGGAAITRTVVVLG